MPKDEPGPLRPCPFCGGKAELYNNNVNEDQVICHSCYCRTLGTNNDIPGAMAQWNRRADTGRELERRVVEAAIIFNKGMLEFDSDPDSEGMYDVEHLKKLREALSALDKARGVSDV